MYGGDHANPDKPDVGMVSRWFAEEELTLVMVQCDVHGKYLDTDVYSHVTATVLYKTQKDADDNILYGGTHVNGNVVGTTSIIAACASSMRAVLAFGGGPIAIQECEYFYQQGIPIMAFEVEPLSGPNLLGAWTVDKLLREEMAAGGGRVYQLPKL